MVTWAITKGRETGLLSHWVAELIWPGKARDFGNCHGLAVVCGAELIAGVIYHNFEPDAGIVELSGAGISRRWLTKETLRVMFQIPFQDWNCQAVVMRVADNNEYLHSILNRVGFERYRIPRLRGRDEAENVFVLTEEAWRGNKFMKGRKIGQA